MRLFDANGLEKNDNVLGASLDSFKHCGGSSQEFWYAAGSANCTALTTGAPSGNAIRVFPFISPARGSYIDRLAVNITTGLMGSGLIGVYKNTNDWTLYPSGLLFQTPHIQTATAAVKTNITKIPIEPGKLYWLAYWNTSSATMRANALAGMWPLLGMASSLGTTPVVGLSYGQTMSTGISVPPINLPSIFPLGARPITAVPLPALFYRLSQ